MSRWSISTLRGAHVRNGVFVAVGAALIAMGVAFAERRGVFPLDDAYIHFAYARCLAATGTFCLNPGEPSMGTSSPLWVAILAAFQLAHANLGVATLAVSFICFAASVALAMGITRESTLGVGASDAEAWLYAGLTGLLLSLNGDLQWLAQSGMETPLATALGLWAIRRYGARGFDPGVGVIVALAFMTRVPGAMLGVALVAVELARGRRFAWWRGAVAAAVAALPVVLVSLKIGGSVVPTTAKGKLLTYVSGGYDFGQMVHFAGRVVELQNYLPHNYVLLGAGLIAAVTLAGRMRGTGPRLTELADRVPELGVLVLWGVLTLAIYTWSFRTLGQHGRYVVEQQYVIAIAGVVSLAYLRRRVMPLWLVRAAFAGAFVLLVYMIPYWQRVIRHNRNLIEDTLVRVADWVRTNTSPDARIAAFDIGVVGYLGDRYIIDLGGLVDPKAHDCLARRECAEYARQNKATYFLYSREPDADECVGIHKAVHFGYPMLLKETPVVEYGYADYGAPTLTHSRRVELDRVDGWFPRDTAGALAVLRDDGANPIAPLERRVSDDLVVAGVEADPKELRWLEDYPYYMRLTLVLRATRPLKDRYWLHVAYFDENQIVHDQTDLVTDGLLAPSDWAVGEALRDVHFVRIPHAGKPWRLKIAVDTMETCDKRYPALHDWIDLGEMTLGASRMRPLAPL
jgi:hypothetical protein